MSLKPTFASIVLFISLFDCFSQIPVRTNEFLTTLSSNRSDSILQLNSEYLVTAVAIQSPEATSFRINLNGAWELIPQDQDVESPTYFISLDDPSHNVQLRVSQNSDFTLHLINSGESPVIERSQLRMSQVNECQDPFTYVDQQIWREGLPEPDYPRSFHEVFHNVVHHSAGSNASTNFTQVVRDIYLYHTQVNGWSDIGYNYLIAQDGTIYAGRDPEDGDQDKVRGAHFCGSNTGTLGVCLLGNYETTTPTDDTWRSLEQLLTFELLKQDLDPFDTNNHPLGTLNAVVGHRDGCATLCPGENVYSMLNDLRNTLVDAIEECTPGNEQLSILADTTLIGVGQTLVLNAVSDHSDYQWLAPGAHPLAVSGAQITVEYGTPGYYDITLIGINGSQRDTLYMEDYIHVSLLEASPVIFPNPIQSNDYVSIDFREDITKTSLFNINGKLINEWNTRDCQLPSLEPGIYILEISTEKEVFRNKLIVL